MALNPYFSQQVKSEQFLYEDIIIESLKIYGQDVYYLPRELVNEDKLFGEDVPSKFSSSYKIEMYVENTDGFEGEGDLFSKFGVQIRDQATFIVARRRWNHVIGQVDNDITTPRPREGDLIYLPLSNSLFQIMHVEHEQPFYQLSNLPTFRLRCELFEYNDEQFDTDIESIDQIEDIGYAITLTLSPGFDSDTPDFIDGDMVYQKLSGGSTIYGEVSNYNYYENTLSLVHIGTDSGVFGMFTTGPIYKDLIPFDIAPNVAQGNLTITRQVLSVVENIEGENSYAQNKILDTETEDTIVDFLDFSEDNPFGDPGGSN